MSSKNEDRYYRKAYPKKYTPKGIAETKNLLRRMDLRADQVYGNLTLLIAFVIALVIVIWIFTSLRTYNATKDFVDISVQLTIYNETDVVSKEFFMTHKHTRESLSLGKFSKDGFDIINYRMTDFDKESPIVFYYYTNSWKKQEFELFYDFKEDEVNRLGELYIYDEDNDGVYEFVYESR